MASDVIRLNCCYRLLIVRDALLDLAQRSCRIALRVLKEIVVLGNRSFENRDVTVVVIESVG